MTTYILRLSTEGRWRHTHHRERRASNQPIRPRHHLIPRQPYRLHSTWRHHGTDQPLLLLASVIDIRFNLAGSKAAIEEACS